MFVARLRDAPEPSSSRDQKAVTNEGVDAMRKPDSQAYLHFLYKDLESKGNYNGHGDLVLDA
jgi:translation initiation factor 2 beta subunit (eIF-2beta)/eIF-5